MDDRDDALRAAFEAVLDARPEPDLPSVTDAAVAGGRRIRRRRRAALCAAGTVAVTATAVVAFLGLSPAGDERTPLPATPVDTRTPTTAIPEPAEEQPVTPSDVMDDPVPTEG